MFEDVLTNLKVSCRSWDISQWALVHFRLDSASQNMCLPIERSWYVGFLSLGIVGGNGGESSLSRSWGQSQIQDKYGRLLMATPLSAFLFIGIL